MNILDFVSETYKIYFYLDDSYEEYRFVFEINNNDKYISYQTLYDIFDYRAKIIKMNLYNI